MTRSSRVFRFFVVINILVVIINLLWVWQNSANGADDNNASQYPLLAKRIFVENPNEILVNFVPLRKQIESQMAGYQVPYSFYFEYLPDGTSIRLGDDQELIAASLIKLPLVMNLYRTAELGKISLEKEVELVAEDIDQGFGALWQRGVGAKITLKQAATLALTESDNTAAHIIFRSINGLLTQDQESLAQLDIEYRFQDGVAVISAKSYASILKCLYFSCYLSRTDSQDILTLLTKSAFSNRLAAPIPKEIAVAHKIGVYQQPLTESDCGIFYVPQRPYLLCIMLGLPEAEADKLMSDVSKRIFDFIKRQ